jgi:hypothetical protein
MNDHDRKQWVNNDEPLYLWWRSTRKGITTFVKENRKAIDDRIYEVLYPSRG